MATLPKVTISVFIWLIAIGVILAFAGSDVAVTEAVMVGGNSAIVIPSAPGAPGTANDPMTIILPVLLAVIATAFIWFSTNEVREEAYEKPKRTALKEEARLNVLLGMMDDDEREAFKETLKRQVLSNMRLSDEGELPAGLGSLLDEEMTQKKKR